MNTVKIFYVGKKKIKKDTVAKTGAVWFGFGDYQSIPEELRARFLVHPTVWVTEAEFRQIEKISKDLPDEPKPNKPKSSEPDVSEPPAGSMKDASEGDSTGATMSLEEAVIHILNENNSDTLTDSGNPKLDAVRELAGDVSVKDVNAVVKKLKGE